MVLHDWMVRRVPCLSIQDCLWHSWDLPIMWLMAFGCSQTSGGTFPDGYGCFSSFYHGSSFMPSTRHEPQWFLYAYTLHDITLLDVIRCTLSRIGYSRFSYVIELWVAAKLLPHDTGILRFFLPRPKGICDVLVHLF